MQIAGFFIEFERGMLHERTKNRFAAIRQDGRVGRRRPKLTSQQRKEIFPFFALEQMQRAWPAFIFPV